MKKKAFTLIELLVVIAVIALLMAILVPTLRRVRNQSRAVVCRANLRQWGTLTTVYVNENEGRLPVSYCGSHASQGVRRPDSWVPDLGISEDLRGIQLCPAASKLANPIAGTGGIPETYLGGTFLAWGRLWPKADKPDYGEGFAYGSYGWNTAVVRHREMDTTQKSPLLWLTADVRGAERIPVQCDSAASPVGSGAGFWEYGATPPPWEPIPSAASLNDSSHFCSAAVCMNRHNGGINMLFLDWSVRKVGLKELWMLKWNKQYDTRGEWTKAGGVEPTDWPQWMRGFKDY